MAILDSHASLASNLIQKNHLAGFRGMVGGAGAGLYLGNSQARLTSNTVLSNSTSAYSEACSGLHIAGGTARLTNTVIAGNTDTELGHGVAPALRIEYGASAQLLHTTIARNSSIGLLAYGEATATLTNTIVASNVTGVETAYDSTIAMEATLWGTGPWANGSDWESPANIMTGTVNLWGDPDFADVGAGDYHILPGSAAMNRGVHAGVDSDIDGEPRPDWCFPDLGADELQTGKPCHRFYLPLVMQDAP
jgi:hypothetical protein